MAKKMREVLEKGFDIANQKKNTMGVGSIRFMSLTKQGSNTILTSRRGVSPENFNKNYLTVDCFNGDAITGC